MKTRKQTSNVQDFLEQTLQMKFSSTAKQCLPSLNKSMEPSDATEGLDSKILKRGPEAQLATTAAVPIRHLPSLMSLL